MFNRISMFALAALAFCGSAAYGQTSNPHVDTSGVNAQPPYPASALQDRETGAVLLSATVDATGAVTTIRPVHTSGFGDLDAAAIGGVMKWHFIPATERGRAVPGTALVQITFQPPDASQSSSGKKGKSADFIEQSFDLEAGPGEQRYRAMAIPCANGSVSVTARFSRASEHYSHSFDARSSVPMMWMTLKTKDGEHFAVLDAAPSFGIAHHQDIRLGLDEVSTWSPDAFHVHPLFQDMTGLKFTWSDYGGVAGTVGGEIRKVSLPSQPAVLFFGVTSASAKFSDAQLTCTPSPTN